MVFPDRTAKPAMHEFKAIAAPVVITGVKAASGQFKIFNKNFFKDLSEYQLQWSITCDGVIQDGGVVKLPKVAPRKSTNFKVSSKKLVKGTSRGERFITFSLVCLATTPWALPMSEVAWSQIALPSTALSAAKKANEIGDVVDEHGQIILPYGIVAPSVSLWRAPTDNDRIGHIASKWERYGIREISRTDCVVRQTATSIKVANTWETSTGVSFKHTQLITPVVGGFNVKESVTIPKAFDDLARVGTLFELDGSLSDLVYFGTGSHESYPDRKIGRIARYVSTVAAQYIPYVRPQENGGHAAVRWFEVTNAAGNGLRFAMSKPAQVSVTPNRDGELADATHDVEVKACGNTVVHIDAAHRGVGTASCGPDTLDKYIIKTGVHTWEWTVTQI
jgi:beta-galactosidase